MAKCNTFFEAATELSARRFRRKQLETGLSSDVLHPHIEAEDVASLVSTRMCVYLRVVKWGLSWASFGCIGLKRASLLIYVGFARIIGGCPPKFWWFVVGVSVLASSLGLLRVGFLLCVFLRCCLALL